MKKKSKKILIYLILACMLLPAVLTACSGKKKQITSLKDLSGESLSVQNGTVFAMQIKENAALADCDVIYGQTTNDAIALLLSGKSDGCVLDNIVAKSIAKKENVLP